jgi:hypothetical protein
MDASKRHAVVIEREERPYSASRGLLETIIKCLREGEVCGGSIQVASSQVVN